MGNVLGLSSSFEVSCNARAPPLRGAVVMRHTLDGRSIVTQNHSTSNEVGKHFFSNSWGARHDPEVTPVWNPHLTHGYD